MIQCLIMSTKVLNPISKEQLKFQSHLENRNLRLTRGRKIIFDEVMQAHGHFAAEELLKQCRQRKRQISRATVYRSLQELLEAGVIRETAFGEKHQHFEHIYDEKPHHHARCMRCHEFTEFPDLHEDGRYRPLLEKQGFHVVGHELHFYGICRNCYNKENN